MSLSGRAPWMMASASNKRLGEREQQQRQRHQAQPGEPPALVAPEKPGRAHHGCMLPTAAGCPRKHQPAAGGMAGVAASRISFRAACTLFACPRPHNSHTATHNATFGLVRKVLAFFSHRDSSQQITRLRGACGQRDSRNSIRHGRILREQEEQRSNLTPRREVLMEATDAARFEMLRAHSLSSSLASSAALAHDIWISHGAYKQSRRRMVLRRRGLRGRLAQCGARHQGRLFARRHRHLRRGHHRQCRSTGRPCISKCTRSSPTARHFLRRTAPIGAAGAPTARRAAFLRRRREAEHTIIRQADARGAISCAPAGRRSSVRSTPRSPTPRAGCSSQ